MDKKFDPSDEIFEDFTKVLNYLMRVICPEKEAEEHESRRSSSEKIALDISESTFGWIDIDLPPSERATETTVRRGRGSQVKLVRARLFDVEFKAVATVTSSNHRPTYIQDDIYSRLGYIDKSSNSDSGNQKWLLECHCFLNGDLFSTYLFPYKHRSDDKFYSVYQQKENICCRSFLPSKRYSTYNERFEEEKFCRQAALRLFDFCWPSGNPSYIAQPNSTDHRYARLYEAFSGKGHIYTLHGYELTEVSEYDATKNTYSAGTVDDYMTCASYLAETQVGEIIDLLLRCDDYHYREIPEKLRTAVSKLPCRQGGNEVPPMEQLFRLLSFDYIDNTNNSKKRIGYPVVFKKTCEDLLNASRTLLPFTTNRLTHSIMTVWFCNLTFRRLT